MYKYVYILFLPLMLSGCIFMTDEIDIPHNSGRNCFMSVPGAEKVTIEVQNKDKRTSLKGHVGTKKGGYGIEMAKIIAKNDIAETFADAVSSELESLGFKIGSGDKTIKVELLRFYNDFKMGFFSADAVADGLINVIVLNNKGKAIFTRSYMGTITVPNAQTETGASARTALMKVMEEIVEEVGQDKDLHAALLKN